MKKDQLKNTFVFPAVFYKRPKYIAVTFPDLPGCVTQTRDDEGPSYENAFELAKEALALHLILMQDEGDEIPQPTPIDQIDEKEIEDGVVALVEVVLPLYRMNFDTVYERKSVTIPKWLNDYAKRKDINFSKVLTDGLLKTLGLSKRE